MGLSSRHPNAKPDLDRLADSEAAGQTCATRWDSGFPPSPSRLLGEDKVRVSATAVAGWAHNVLGLQVRLAIEQHVNSVHMAAGSSRNERRPVIL